MAAPSPMLHRPCTLSPSDLAGIARTFDRVTAAIWVHDLSGRCVYRNPTAGRAAPSAQHDQHHDLLDQHDRCIGQIRVRPA